MNNIEKGIDEKKEESIEFIEIWEQSRWEGDKMVVVQLMIEYEMGVRRKWEWGVG